MKTIALVLLLITVGRPSEAQVWNPLTDFSATDNPTGTWSYGWSEPGLTSPTVLYIPVGTILGLDWWFFDSQPNPTSWPLPAVFRNATGHTVIASGGLAIPADSLVFHPGPLGERSVIRWTAPADGTYRVEGALAAIDADPGNVDVSIRIGSPETPLQIFGELLGTSNNVGFFDETVTLSEGEVVEFTVGVGTVDFFNDSVLVDVAITALPEPTLAADVHSISLASGGTQNLAVDLGAGSGDLVYGLLGSASGTSPGVNLGGGLTLPLVLDAYSKLTLNTSSSSIFQDFVGVLDSQGTADAALALPPLMDTSLAGLVLRHAGIAFDANFVPVAVTAAVPVVLAL